MQESNSNSFALDNTIVVYKDHGTCNLTTHNHSQSIPQTSWNQSETSTLSKTLDVGLINLELVSSTTSISSDAQAIISVAWRNTTKQNTTVHSKDGQTFVVKGISIHCNQIQ